MTKHCLTITDFSADELHQILELSESFCNKKSDHLRDCCVGLIFEKPSNRTRLSFDVGIKQMGGHPVVIRDEEIQLGRREPVSHVSRVLSRYLDLIVYRTTDHNKLIELAKYSGVPVINGLSDVSHPCQAIADSLTIKQHFGDFDDVYLTYVGDGNNVCQSLMEIAHVLGIKMAVVSPKGYAPLYAPDSILLTDNLADVISKTNVIYTDVWVSMGDESEKMKRQHDFSSYQINASMLGAAKQDCIFLHCLPANLGQEVSNDVFESAQSKVFDQAENRLHAQKGIMAWLMQQKGSSK